MEGASDGSVTGMRVTSGTNRYDAGIGGNVGVSTM